MTKFSITPHKHQKEFNPFDLTLTIENAKELDDIIRAVASMAYAPWYQTYDALVAYNKEKNRE